MAPRGSDPVADEGGESQDLPCKQDLNPTALQAGPGPRPENSEASPRPDPGLQVSLSQLQVGAESTAEPEGPSLWPRQRARARPAGTRRPHPAAAAGAEQPRRGVWIQPPILKEPVRTHSGRAPRRLGLCPNPSLEGSERPSEGAKTLFLLYGCSANSSPASPALSHGAHGIKCASACQVMTETLPPSAPGRPVGAAAGTLRRAAPFHRLSRYSWQTGCAWHLPGAPSTRSQKVHELSHPSLQPLQREADLPVTRPGITPASRSTESGEGRERGRGRKEGVARPSSTPGSWRRRDVWHVFIFYGGETPVR